MKKKLEYKVTCKVFPTDIVQRVSRLHADIILARQKSNKVGETPADNESSRIEGRA